MAELTLYYATNRRHKGKNQWRPGGYGTELSRSGSENLRFGKVSLKYDKATAQKYLEKGSGFGVGDGEELAGYLYKKRGQARIEAFRERLETDVADTEQDKAKFGSSRTFNDLREKMRCGCEVLIYVHGFNVNWWEAVSTAASLQMMLNRGDDGKELLVVLFTWPSDGRMVPYWSYYSDRNDAQHSGAAVGRGILKLRDFLIDTRRRDAKLKIAPCRQAIHLLCHSMGNYVLQVALQRTREFSSGGKPPRIFEQIFLCSADVADDAFEPDQPFRRLPELGQQVTVYHNRGDMAMPVSDYTKGNTDRLGWGGANRPGDLDGRVHQVDCSPIVTGLVEHSYYLCGKVNDDIRQSLDGCPPENEARRRKPVRHGWPNVWRMV